MTISQEKGRVKYFAGFCGSLYKPFMIMSRYTTNENVPVVVYLFSYDVGE